MANIDLFFRKYSSYYLYWYKHLCCVKTTSYGHQRKPQKLLLEAIITIEQHHMEIHIKIA
jgi:hypothetical protein